MPQIPGETVTVSTFSGGVTNTNTIDAGSTGILVGGYASGDQVVRAALPVFGPDISPDFSISKPPGSVTVSSFSGNIVNSTDAAVTGDQGIVVGGNANNGGVVTVSTFTGDIINATNATITADFDGILVGGDAQSGGVVTVSNFTGAIINAGTINASNDGIVVGGQATVLDFSSGITNTGTISVTGYGDGILVGGNPFPGSPFAEVSQFSGGITNAGTISVGSVTTGATGIAVGGNAYNSGDSITVSTFSGGITNAGTLSASGEGILVGGNAASAGSVTVATFSGNIVNSAGGTIYAGSSAIVVGGFAGSSASIAVSTFSGDVVNAGTISAGYDGIIVGGFASDHGSVTVASFTGGIDNDGGKISAGGAGIIVGGTAYSGGTVTVSNFSGGITNSGNITAFAADIVVGGRMFNTPLATHPLVTISTFSGGITNSGAISAGQAGIGVGGTTPLAATISDFSGGITNTGTISANFGIAVSDDLTFSGGIDNGGTITGGVTGIGVFYIEDFSGGVTNTGTVIGATGIDLTGTPGVQLFNSGTIIGTGGTAIEFDGPSDNTLTLAPGYSITGDVLGGGTDTLQLAGLGSSNFDLSDVGSQYTGFTTLDVVGGIWSATGTGSDWNVEGGTFEVSGSVTDTTVDSGGTLEILSGGAGTGFIDFEGVGGALRIDGTPAPGLLLGGTTLDDFKPGDTIDLTGIDYTTPNSPFVDGSDQLQITEGGKTYEIQLSGDFTGDTFHLAADNSGRGPGTEITETPCYCPGTLIRTERGEQRVEQLKIGDEVLTASGALRPIKWIGRRSYSGRLAMGRKDILPVCIKAGALEDNVPKRDL